MDAIFADSATDHHNQITRMRLLFVARFAAGLRWHEPAGAAENQGFA